MHENQHTFRQLSLGAIVALSVMFSSVNGQSVNQAACWVQGERSDLELRASPFDSTTLSFAAGTVKLCYSRPRKLGRPIMGRVVPYAKPWRMGADEATSIYLPVRGRVAGVALEPGWYSLYSIPDEKAWRIVVNGTARRWGTRIDDGVRAMDVGSGIVAAESVSESEDLLRMRLHRVSDAAAELIVQWDRTRVRIPIDLSPRP